MKKKNARKKIKKIRERMMREDAGVMIEVMITETIEVEIVMVTEETEGIDLTDERERALVVGPDLIEALVPMRAPGVPILSTEIGGTGIGIEITTDVTATVTETETEITIVGESGNLVVGC